MIYFENRLSKNHDLSCNSCHDLAKYGVDGRAFSQGHKKQLGGRNAPTVYNAGDHVAQFWDGRAATLEEQATGPITNPVEMAMADGDQVVKVLSSIPEYVELFKKAFPGDKTPITLGNVGRAIGAFERGLITPSRFDKFLAGDKAALNKLEKQGLKKFVEVGCVTCHNGSAVGGSSFQKLGLVEDYPDQKDLGRFAVTKEDADKMKFRVPSLRNIEKTAPYFHTGKYKRVEEVIPVMAKHQLGAKVTPTEVKQISAFLRTLTGDLPSEYIKVPKLPASTQDTPKPDPT
jgi:cytochrome c peroxidase